MPPTSVHHSAAPRSASAVQSAIAAHNIQFSYRKGAAPAIVCPELTIHPGTVTSVIGLSGSGKSTLLNLFSGLLKTSQGSLVMGGQELGGTSATRRATFRAKRAGLIFQDYGLIEGLNAWENIVMAARLAGQKLTREQAEAELAAVGLADYTDRMTWELSGGQKQRVAVARAFAKGPAFIFADEPTSALDKDTGAMVWSRLTAHAHERGATVVVVTHDRTLATSADRYVHVVDGVAGQALPTAAIDLSLLADVTAADGSQGIDVRGERAGV